jgi:hypothetical protein
VLSNDHGDLKGLADLVDEHRSIDHRLGFIDNWPKSLLDVAQEEDGFLLAEVSWERSVAEPHRRSYRWGVWPTFSELQSPQLLPDGRHGGLASAAVAALCGGSEEERRIGASPVLSDPPDLISL